MKAVVEVTTTIEVEADDAVVDELMTDEWQSHYYTFSERNEAVAWLAWVVQEWDGPDHVDGLVGIGNVTTHIVSRDQWVIR